MEFRTTYVIILSALLWASNAHGQERLVLQSSLPEYAAPTRAAKQFAETVAKRAGGALQIDVIAAPPGAGWPRSLFAALDQGKADLIVGYYSAAAFPEGPLGALPGLVSNPQEAQRFAGTPLARAFASLLEQRLRARNLAWIWERNVIVSRGAAIYGPREAQARRVRAVGPYIALFREAGASAMALPLSETWTAIERGLADSAVMPLWMAPGAPAGWYVALPADGAGFYSLLTIAIAPRTFDRLSPELQRALSAEPYIALDAEERSAIEAARSKGAQIVRVGAEFTEWRALARNKVWQPVFAGMNLGTDVLSLLMAE